MKKTLFAVLLCTLASTFVCAQSPKGDFQIYTQLDFVTRHSWRGGMEGGAPSLEPTIEFRKGKWTIGTWFAATFDDKYKELDLYVTYSPTSQFSVSLFDYYCPPTKLSDAHFYKLGKTDTRHLFDIIFNYQFKKFPLKLTAATLFAGMDTDEKEDLRYSTYLEAAYTYSWHNYDLTAVVAGTPWEGIYASKADFVNLELKLAHNFKLKKGVDFPIFGRVVHNPYRNETYYIAGFSFSGLTKF